MRSDSHSTDFSLPVFASGAGVNCRNSGAGVRCRREVSQAAKAECDRDESQCSTKTCSAKTPDLAGSLQMSFAALRMDVLRCWESAGSPRDAQRRVICSTQARRSSGSSSSSCWLASRSISRTLPYSPAIGLPTSLSSSTPVETAYLTPTDS